MENIPFNVYVANLSARKERKENIYKEFKDRNEFYLHVVSAFEDPIGAIGLWKTIQHIFKEWVNKEESFIILCEDDHQFTQKYDCHFLIERIKEAQEKNADVLLGGVSWFKDAIQVSENLFWVEKFSGLQFTIIFKKFYEKILSARFSETDVADHKISSLSDKKFIIFPFISTQKEFGYSDVTKRNNEAGFVERICLESSERLQLLIKVNTFYNMS